MTSHGFGAVYVDEVMKTQDWKSSQTQPAPVSIPKQLFAPHLQLTSALNGLFAAKGATVLQIVEDCKARREVIKAQIAQEAQEKGFVSIFLNYARMKDNAGPVKELFLGGVYSATSNPKVVTLVEDETALDDAVVVNFLKRRGLTRIIAMHSAEKQDAVGPKESFIREKAFQPSQMTSEEKEGFLDAHFAALNVSDVARPQWMKLYLFLLESQPDRSFNEFLELVEADMTNGLNTYSVTERCSYLAHEHGRGELTEMDFLYVADAKQVPLLFRIKKVANSILCALGLSLLALIGKMLGVGALIAQVLSPLLSYGEVTWSCALKIIVFAKTVF